jgi:hypothetical protein
MLGDVIDSVINEQLRAFGENVLKAGVEGLLREDDTVATGDSIRSLEIDVKKYVLELSGFGYLKAVDEGQPAGTIASISNLMKWIDAKQLAPPENIESYAYGIQQAIYKRGTIKRFNYEGSGFIDKAIERFSPDLVRVLEQDISAKVKLYLQQKYTQK